MAKQAVKCSEEMEFQVEEKKIPSLGGITTAKPYGYIWRQKLKGEIPSPIRHYLPVPAHYVMQEHLGVVKTAKLYI